MRIAIIGRTEWLLDIAEVLYLNGYEIPLVITAKEAPEYKAKKEDFERFANRIGAIYLFGSRIDSEEIMKSFIKIGKIDLGVSINYSGIIPKNIIDFFNIGILNAHGGDLPKYKGNACQAWAIINGENKIGMCIHKMIGGELDSGDIIIKDYFQLNQNTRIGEYHYWAEKAVPRLMIEAIKILKNNPGYFLEKQSTKAIDSLRCYPRQPEDGKINWSKKNIEILRLINASSEPYSGAFCEYENKKLIIWRASIIEETEKYLAIPGQVSKIYNNGTCEVICGDGKLLLIEIEINGVRTLKPSTILNSVRKRLK